MRSHAMSRGRLFVVCVLGALAGVVPTASADTTLPVWTCRASAAYVEVDPLLGDQRVEPVLANGFPDRANPDSEQCASSETGVQNVDIPVSEIGAPLVSLEAASASTAIEPQIRPAREQVASADAGVAETVHIELPGLIIDAEAVTATAEGRCVDGAPQLTGSSEILRLTVNGDEIVLPPGTEEQLTDINLLPLARIRLNQQVVDDEGDEQSLTQRAVHIELLQADPDAEPLARVVLAEAKVDFHGDVCAPPVECPEGFEAQDPDANPLVCLRTVTAPCPEGSTADPTKGGACVANCPDGTTREGSGACIREVAAPCPTGTTGDPNAGGACIREVTAPCPTNSTADPNRGGACVIVEQAPPANCPTPTTRDPATNNCVLIRDRPCPEGATPDPTTRVCVQRVTNNVASGENGRIGSPTGPRATCGRLDMFFVRGGFRSVGRSFTSQFGTRTVTRGRLVTCGSNPRPIIGARVDVVHVLPGNKRRRKTGLRSRANGRLTLILPIDLRTRRIEYAYRPDLRSTRVTSRVTLRLTVRSKTGRILR